MWNYGEIWGIRDIGEIWVWKLIRGWNIGWLERVGICEEMGNFERFLGRFWENLGVL